MILGGSVLAVALASLAFVGGHFALSHPLRSSLLRAVGEKAFSGVYSVIVALAFVWLIHAHATAPYVAIWGDPVWARPLLALVMVPAVLLVVLGLTSRNPTLGPRGAAALAGSGQGVLAITRHPMLWGFALWAIGHMLANGDQATVILTAGILILSLGGAAAIDAKKLRQLGAPYQAFMAQTSFVPMVAIAQGRAKLSMRDIGWWRIGVAVLVYAALVLVHPYVIGRPAIGM
jgi:uncharacterized membrane protein